jgi:hypothetical protein
MSIHALHVMRSRLNRQIERNVQLEAKNRSLLMEIARLEADLRHDSRLIRMVRRIERTLERLFHRDHLITGTRSNPD